MDVRFCEGRNHRREARVRAAGSARVRRARSSEARLRRIFFLLDEDLHGCRQTFHHQVRERLPRNPAGELNSVTPAINSQWGCVLKQSPLVYMGSNRPSLTSASESSMKAISSCRTHSTSAGRSALCKAPRASITSFLDMSVRECWDQGETTLSKYSTNLDFPSYYQVRIA